MVAICIELHRNWIIIYLDHLHTLPFKKSAFTKSLLGRKLMFENIENFLVPCTAFMHWTCISWYEKRKQAIFALKYVLSGVLYEMSLLLDCGQALF